jgi:hypothetical protein
MAILRNELPKPLNLEQIYETICNPNNHIINKIQNRNIKSARSKLFSLPFNYTANNSEFISSNEASTLKADANENLIQSAIPLIFNTQTNDGTNCVYYPNGQIAIVSSTVFGFYIDNLPTNNNQSHNINNSFNLTDQTSNAKEKNNFEKGLSWHTIVNSYTTIVYDMTENKEKKSSRGCNKSPLSSYTNALSINTNSDIKSSLYSDLNATSKNKISNNLNNHFKYTNYMNEKPNILKQEPKILALITSTGHCVCYRENGTPR